MSERNPRSGTPVTRRRFLHGTAAAVGGVLAAPYVVSRASAAPTELTMLAWYGHGEPDIVGAFEKANNVKFKPKYYAGGDNMLALIAQSPPGTYDVILSDAEFVQQLNRGAGLYRAPGPERLPVRRHAARGLQEVPGTLGRRHAVLDDGAVRAPRRQLQYEGDLGQGSHELQVLLENPR